MQQQTRRAWQTTALALGALVVCSGAWAQAAGGAGAVGDWPTRPITLVVPFPPGGTSDVIGRQLAKQLGDQLKVSVVVDNKPGAATTLGASHVARAAKDGHTLLLSTGSTFTVSPHLMPVTYQLSDFAPLGTVATVPFAFLVKNDLPVKTVAEFVALAKSKPGTLNNATNGQGSLVHLLGELLATETGTELTQVHYKGAAPAMADLMSGVVDTNIEALTNAVPNVKAGKYRALAVLSEQREPLLPDVPTFKEQGFPNVLGQTWYAVFAPAGTPAAVADKLSAAVQHVTASPEFAKAMTQTGNRAHPGTPQALLKVTNDESAKWGALIKRLNIRLN